VQVLLISTYELGRQPVHLASPAAALRAAGHEVRTVDLATDQMAGDDIAWADRVGISVPMHTATRIADEIVRALASERPDLPVCLFGLYAGVASEPVDARFEGEYEPSLLEWAQGQRTGDVRHLGRSQLQVLDRSGLPDLGAYARLEMSGTTRLAGAVEASHGCRHRCRHCPIPAVYDGRIRVVPQPNVLEDIDNLVSAGAEHITFGDADFLNAPAHSLSLIESAHEAHPGITFDATIKVEHLVDHADLLERLAAANLLFVVSAFESVDPATLEILDKGHTVDDMVRAVGLVKGAGINIRPTWLPFFPWTEPDDVADIFEFLAGNDLVSATDPVQMAIKLLVPRGSLLETHPSLLPHLKGYDNAALTWRWEFADDRTAVLFEDLETIAADASDCGQETAVTLNEMRSAVAHASGRTIPPFVHGHDVPRLTESWYCCAEPTRAQTVTLTIGR
jgi:Radical SAM superfamily